MLCLLSPGHRDKVTDNTLEREPNDDTAGENDDTTNEGTVSEINYKKKLRKGEKNNTPPILIKSPFSTGEEDHTAIFCIWPGRTSSGPCLSGRNTIIADEEVLI